MVRTPRALLLAAGLALLAPPAFSGQNAGGTVRLSWDENGAVEARAVPSGAHFPLYLHLSGAPYVQQLALMLRWVPFDSTAECFGLLSADEQVDCGWVVNSPPNGDFEGDSTYAWSTHFPAGSTDRSCVVYWFSMAGCDSVPPAKFYVASCLVKDGFGEVDTLRNAGDAKLLGGPLADTLAAEPQFALGQPEWGDRIALTVVPNPASAQMTLRFQGPKAQSYSLSIYDVGGRLLRRLRGIADSDGAGQLTWDLTDRDGQRVRVGWYFARLTTTAGSRVVPLVVLR